MKLSENQKEAIKGFAKSALWTETLKPLIEDECDRMADMRVKLQDEDRGLMYDKATFAETCNGRRIATVIMQEYFIKLIDGLAEDVEKTEEDKKKDSFE